jgi:hypothetical protein
MFKKRIGEKNINRSLKNVKRYLGSFKTSELDEIKIDNFPLFVILEVLSDQKTVPYYIAMAIYSKEIYICDSLGYLIQCEHLPHTLINYLNVIIRDRQVHITRQLQNSSKNLSAAYCTFFVREMNRVNSFKHFLSYFTCNRNKNDQIISLLY